MITRRYGDYGRENHLITRIPLYPRETYYRTRPGFTDILRSGFIPCVFQSSLLPAAAAVAAGLRVPEPFCVWRVRNGERVRAVHSCGCCVLDRSARMPLAGQKESIQCRNLMKVVRLHRRHNIRSLFPKRSRRIDIVCTNKSLHGDVHADNVKIIIFTFSVCVCVCVSLFLKSTRLMRSLETLNFV